MSGGSLYRVLVQQPAAGEEEERSQDDRVTFSSDSPMAGLISHEKKILCIIRGLWQRLLSTSSFHP